MFTTGALETSPLTCRIGRLGDRCEPNRDLASRTGAIVVSATYRRAPEHRFPAAHDDAYAALQWVRANIADFGGDPERIVLAGDSAGGNLAGAAAVRAAREGLGLAGLLLIYPLVAPLADTASRLEYAAGYVIEQADLEPAGRRLRDGSAAWPMVCSGCPLRSSVPRSNARLLRSS